MTLNANNEADDMSHRYERPRPLSDDEMELRAQHNIKLDEVPRSVELDLGGNGPDIDLSFLDAPATTEGSAPPKKKIDAARLALYEKGIARAQELTTLNKARYRGQRKKDREEKRLQYAIKVQVEQDRAVRPHMDLSAMSADEKADHKREQARLRQQKRRQQKRSSGS
ncbi:hypothetical protein EN866_24185 [Mesorhizobium sp. M2D.F.Ca.ET.223.01.1.1]|uniref:hypothetical protein n=1 Tax=Mesorhizobium sp. M2D.F.Ca.ET.223.01.1.1 TaxID=2563940 RepID=UPI001092B8AA|nr:hypothetical protein [Mesorhizobium sp. M2D.F.Ca.ET.223.01.1.1]TGP86400.1 hypothetical protein EN864_24195 [bacterium M00.F.Ca.ET.221.01.1.1]TGR88742.1 hypothetical protein EN866_24185 [Mesorhizobium sp. M2D.F.Ca.ET.223.01.1.1]